MPVAAPALGHHKMSYEDIARVRQAVASCPILDNHCHPISDNLNLKIASCFSEASGGALQDSTTVLSVQRGIRDVAALLGCGATAAEVEATRRAKGTTAVAQTCFQASNIKGILVDDGLRGEGMLTLEAHRKFVPYVGRVMRIETVAEDILSRDQRKLGLLPASDDPVVRGAVPGEEWTLDQFEAEMLRALDPPPPEVVALKSVACYRSGLEINPHTSRAEAEAGLQATIYAARAGTTGDRGKVRLTSKALIDWLFVLALEAATRRRLPLQLHTGFGDTDLDLRQSSALHLRGILEDPRFAESRLVLLHAAYPFTREAGFLTATYRQVYLDFGLAVPLLSGQGMRTALRECLHLSPTSKLLFSTDAHFFPEGYYVGVARGRDVIASQLCEAVEDGDLTVDGAISAAHSILHNNALRLYGLPSTLAPVPLRPADPPAPSVPARSALPAGEVAARGHSGPGWGGGVGPMPSGVRPLPPPGVLDPCPPGVKYVDLLWSDSGGLRRSRVVPARSVYHGGPAGTHGVGLTSGCMGKPSHADVVVPASGLSPVGTIRAIPDPSTLVPCPWNRAHVMAVVDMHVVPGQEWEYCPRAALRRAARDLEAEFGLGLRVGFEMEFLLLRGEGGPVDRSIYCDAGAAIASAPFLEEAVEAIEEMGVQVEMWHAESAPGQFEIVASHLPALEAADKLLMARVAVAAVAQKHGLRATFVPKYAEGSAGSGCHLHFSLVGGEGRSRMSAPGRGEAGPCPGLSADAESFASGVLHHMAALMAFTAPSPNSAKRVRPGAWAGAFRCWGPENREAPLRACYAPEAGMGGAAPTNFEYKLHDGSASPHVAMAAMVFAGLDGMRKGMRLPEPVLVDPCAMGEEEREKIGLERLPYCVDDAVKAARADEAEPVRRGMGEALCKALLAVREAEDERYSFFKLKEEAEHLSHRI